MRKKIKTKYRSLLMMRKFIIVYDLLYITCGYIEYINIYSCHFYYPNKFCVTMQTRGILLFSITPSIKHTFEKKKINRYKRKTIQQCGSDGVRLMVYNGQTRCPECGDLLLGDSDTPGLYQTDHLFCITTQRVRLIFHPSMHQLCLNIKVDGKNQPNHVVQLDNN